MMHFTPLPAPWMITINLDEALEGHHVSFGTIG